ncbi:MAG TPA: hypothetical protein VMS82_13015 [Pseudolabrys sp.]|nr:hypothetical protein [Pseudolabrys sp.]
MDAAAALAPERRSVFLERCGAMLRMRRRFTDGDVADVERSWRCAGLCNKLPTVRREFGFLQSWGQAPTNPLAGSPLKQKIRYVARETKLKL